AAPSTPKDFRPPGASRPLRPTDGADGVFANRRGAGARNIAHASDLLQKFNFLAKPPQLAIRTAHLSGCGGIGRRNGFRFRRGNSWGFKSLQPHQAPDPPT